jgi:two-component system OmpR family response regulator
MNKITDAFHIAIVEDDAILREELGQFLRSHDLVVSEVNNGISLKELLSEQEIQLVILDINLPGQNGLELAEYLRINFPQIRIVMLTAKTALSDRVKGYDCGADIYIPKPASPAELLSAITSLARRASKPSTTQKWRLNRQTRQITLPGGSAIPLTAIEFALITTLKLAPNQTLDSEDICQQLSNLSSHQELSKRALENSISRLRKKLSHDNAGGNSLVIQSVWGRGYQLCIPLIIEES